MPRWVLLLLLLVSPVLSGHMCGRMSGDPVKQILEQKLWKTDARAQARVRFDPARPARIRLVISGNPDAFPVFGPQPSTGGLHVGLLRNAPLPDPAKVRFTAKATVPGSPRPSEVRAWPASSEHWSVLSVDWWRQEEGRCGAQAGCEREIDLEFTQTQGQPFEFDLLFKAYLYGPERKDGPTFGGGDPKITVRVLPGG